jgi:quercetin dioxygenase-like cupin family protein
MSTATSAPTPLLRLGSSQVVEHLGGDDTNGSLALLEFSVAPGYPVPPPHVHEREDELTFVVEGTLEVRVGDETHVVSAGRSVFKPRGIPHAFAVVGDEPVRFLETLTPAGFERYFHDVAAALRDGGPPAPELTAELMAGYGVRSA